MKLHLRAVSGIICLRAAIGLLLVGTPQSIAIESFNWPYYRGINHDGISEETNLNIDNLEKRWQVNVHTGFSGVTVVDNALFTMGNKDDQDIVYCLDAANGKIIWTHAYECKLDPNLYEGGPNATPTIHNGKVYTLSKEGHIFCLDQATGKTLWSRHAVNEFKAKPPSWGFSSSPTIVGDHVIYNIGAKGLALHKDTGKAVWSSKGKSAGYASAMPYNTMGKVGILMFTGDELKSLNPLDGKEHWSYPWKTSYNVNAAAPIVFSNYVFISSGYNEGCTVLDVSHSRVKELWMNKKLRNQFNSSILSKGKIYGIDGNSGRRNKFVCLNSIDGAVFWSKKDFGFGSLILADKKLFALRENGELVIVEARRDKYSELARKKILNGRCWTVPTVCNRKLYARDAEGVLVCLDLDSKPKDNVKGTIDAQGK